MPNAENEIKKSRVIAFEMDEAKCSSVKEDGT